MRCGPLAAILPGTRHPMSPATRSAFLVLLIAPATLHAGTEAWLDDFDLSQMATGFSSAQKNRSLNKKPLGIGGSAFQRGVGTHAPSQAYFLNEGSGPLRFQASVGLDDSTDGPGTVSFQILGDDKVLFNSGLVGKGDAARKVDVDLGGKKIIELRVTDGGDGKNYDHADWAEAKFIHEGKAPVISPRWVMELPHFDQAASGLPSIGSHGVDSPNGEVKVGVVRYGDYLALSAIHGKQLFLPFAPLGITVDGVDLGKDAGLAGKEEERIDETYEFPPTHKPRHARANGAKFSVETKGVAQKWKLELRVSDEGFAWRYIIPGSGKRKVTGEASSFILPEGSTYWTHRNTANYEANYQRFTAEGRTPGRPVTMPLTVELPDGGYACITEANIIGYSGMSLGPRGTLLNGIFEDDPKGWTMEGEIVTPWRIVISAPDLTALVNQGLVYDVSPPPDPKLFPQGAKTAWIQPGRAYWTWGFGQWDTAKWERIKGYVDEAAKLNCQYYTIDDPWREPKMGWHRNGKDEWASLKEVCDYAATKKVKIMVWEHWERLRDLAKREDFLAKVAKAGAVGVKIDFMDSESQERLAFFKSCLEIAAKHKIMINFHGANKPAGEERTWPHWMTREAIYGMEQGGNITRQHLAALPFTRLVTGPADFTPTVFRAGPMGKTTAGSQMATAVAYDSPLHHWADSAESYLAQPPEVLDFIRSKPVVWDELRVLPGSKIGELAVVARRSGSTWWIGGINGTDERKEYALDLDLPGSPEWDFLRYADQPGDKTKLSIQKGHAKRGEKLPLVMEAGGGFVIILRKG